MSTAITSLQGSVNVAIIGVGLVGTSVISQILTSPTLSKSLSIVALQNSKKLLLLDGSSSKITESNWKQLLADSDRAAPSSPEEIIPLLLQLPQKQHTVVVDNTSNDNVAQTYPKFLQAGFSVVTPNKKGYSGPKALFDSILSSMAPRSPSVSPPLVYLESTVGAGLPIISTLKDLIATGDEITKIEGVLSGTLSYIFNVWCPPSLDSTAKFSDVVRVAKENGYTEPYPGDDLSGSDVARKLTILSRLIPALVSSVPLPEGYLSVDTASLTPENIASAEKSGELKGSAADGDKYIEMLKASDAHFDQMREEAKREKKVWRYVGVIDAQTKEVKAQLAKYPATHPFAASLGGSDNIISFTTKRYSQRPLLVQGSGAGADVTAMGVVADLIKVAERRGAVA